MLVVRFAACMVVAGFLGIFCSESQLAQADQTALVKVDGSSSVYPAHGGGRGRISESEPRPHTSDGRHFWHRRRIQEVLSR